VDGEESRDPRSFFVAIYGFRRLFLDHVEGA
jgi:hypothetical protein